MLHAFSIRIYVTCLLKYTVYLTVQLEYVYQSFQKGAHVTSKCNKLLCCVNLFPFFVIHLWIIRLDHTSSKIHKSFEFRCYI